LPTKYLGSTEGKDCSFVIAFACKKYDEMLKLYSTRHCIS
jgi:hypothetical protein